MRSAIPKSIFVLIAIIATAAIILSIFSYQYSTSAASKIVDIASNEIDSNARIQAHDFAQILSNRLESITPLLQTLAQAPSIQNEEPESQVIMNQRQNSTRDLTDFYMWLDKDGKIVWISNLNSTAYQKYKDFDLSYRPYFTEPRKNHNPYHSSIIDSNDKVPRLYISYPILSTHTGLGGEEAPTNTTGIGDFKGVVVTAIEVNTLGNLLKNQLFPQFNSTIALLDNNGMIIYTNNQSFIGEDIFGEEFQSTLRSAISPKEVESLNDIVKISLQANSSGSRDIPILGKINTLAYEPVKIQGKHFLTLFVSAPHNLAGDVSAAIDQQRNLSIFIVVIIGAIAIGIAFLLITWNRGLEKTVNTRTAELKRANEQLKVNDKMQKEFINIASHEIKTPTQAILGYTHLLEEHPDKKAEILEVLKRNANRLQRLTSDILDVTRIESQTLMLNKEKLNLNDLVLGIVEDNKREVEKRYNGKVKLSYEPKEEYIAVEADKNRLSQVLSNLISNAIKFTKEGTIAINVERVNSSNKDHNNNNKNEEVVVNVRDTGLGIDPEILPRLFSKFATKSETGTGLGLFISKSIIEAHGGRIWAENYQYDGKKGANFAFSLPAP